MAEMSLLDKAISIISPQWAHSRLQYRRAIEASSGRYRGASSDRLRSDWNVVKTDPTPNAWELEKLRNRTRDLSCNDPIVSGLVGTYGYNVVGSGLKFESRINNELLGITPEQAEIMRHEIERIWEDAAKQIDHAGILSFDEMQFQALMRVIEDGEMFPIPTMRNDPWRQIKRTIQHVEADQLEKEGYGSPIDVDAGGRPTAYHFKEVEVDQFGNQRTVGHKTIPALDSQGRKKVLHLYRPSRPGQLRGVSILAPILTLLKDFCDTREAYVVKERVQACLTVVFTKKNGNPVMEALGHSTSTEETNDTASNRLQALEPGLIYYNNEGDDVQMLDPGKTGDGQSAFIENTIRLIGAACQLPYELLLKDFSKTNYSSARAALLEGRRAFTTWRKWLARYYCQPIFELVMEEAVLRGLINLPGFYDRRSIYLTGDWVGGAWGWVQPVQEIEAARRAVDYGLSTLADENAAQGRDWENTVRQNAIENRYIDAKGALITRAQKNAHKNEDAPPTSQNTKGNDDEQDNS